MKALIVIGSWCLLACSVWSQNADTLNQKDAEGRKQGHWIYYGTDRPESGIAQDGKVEEGSYVNDRKEGLWIKYHDDGKTPKLKGYYENNRPKGQYFRYDQYGHLRDSGNFDKNQSHDSLRRGGHYGSYPNEYVASYNHRGKEEGTVSYYYSSGRLEYTGKFHNGIPYDTAYRYFENGALKELIVFGDDGNVLSSQQFEMKNPPFVDPNPKNPNDLAPPVGTTPQTRGVKWQPNGYNKVYNEDDEIWQEGVFREGKLWDGKLHIYDSDGILLKVKVYKSGHYHSDGQL